MVDIEGPRPLSITLGILRQRHAKLCAELPGTGAVGVWVHPSLEGEARAVPGFIPAEKYVFSLPRDPDEFGCAERFSFYIDRSREDVGWLMIPVGPHRPNSRKRVAERLYEFVWRREGKPAPPFDRLSIDEQRPFDDEAQEILRLCAPAT